MHSRVSLWVWVQIAINNIGINVSCCTVIMIPWERPGNVVLIVGTSRGGFLALGPWYHSDPFQELNRKLHLTYDVTTIKKYNTLIAAKWIVWGMHRMRASCAKKEMPHCWHCDSSDVISVLLLLALSITIAVTPLLSLCHALISFSVSTLMCTTGPSISIYWTYLGLSHYLDI